MKKVLLVMTILVAMSASAFATGEIAKNAKALLEKNQKAVVGISGVMKIEMAGRDAQEQPLDTIGTVIDESGLTVVSCTMIDPVALLGAGMGAKVNTSDVKIVLADDTEIAAEVIMKDPDLDLAFLRPVKKEGVELPKFAFVKLEKNNAFGLLDDLIFLSRASKEFNRVPSLSLGNVSAIVKKPRTFMLFNMPGSVSLGIPVFNAASKPIGLCVLRVTPGSQGRPTPILLPCSDVMEAAVEAKKAKGPLPEEKPEAPAMQMPPAGMGGMTMPPAGMTMPPKSK